MASIYSKDLKNNQIKIKPNLVISSFIPRGILEMVEEKVPKNYYVLGVTYYKGDSQICISGHPKENETILEGLKREVQEELALTFKKKFIEGKKIGNNNTYYHCDISLMKLDPCNTKNTYPDVKERVVVCIYGKEKDILYYLARVKYIDGFNEDKIKEIYAIKKENLVSYLKTKNFSKLYNDI